MNIDRENSLLNQKIVYDLTKFTTTDYIGELACVVWHISCNLRCTYCYNDKIVFAKSGFYSHNDILEFLKKRVGLLTAVVLSGGEATMHDLKPFCIELRKFGFKIKLDTNGLNIKMLKELIQEGLIDFISLDFKATKDKFVEITQIKSSKLSYENFIETLKYLIEIKFSFELRTTINSLLLDENDINNIIKIAYSLGYRDTFYIQNFLETESNIGDIKAGLSLDKNLLNNTLLNLEFRN